MTEQPDLAPRISFDDDLLLLVNAEDEVIGEKSKLDCHLGEGLLHRAFSVFLFNEAGEVLLQQRTADKFLWPMYWSNSCCSHPRIGETDEEAALRRVRQELGVNSSLRFHHKFEYSARFLDADGRHLGTEREVCWVWVGTTSENIEVNPREVADWRYLTPGSLDRELLETPESFTPWMKMEWQRVRPDPG